MKIRDAHVRIGELETEMGELKTEMEALKVKVAEFERIISQLANSHGIHYVSDFERAFLERKAELQREQANKK